MKSGYDRNLLCLQIRNLDGVRLLWSLLKNPTDNVQVRCARQGSCAVPPHLWPQSHTFYIVIVILHSNYLWWLHLQPRNCHYAVIINLRTHSLHYSLMARLTANTHTTLHLFYHDNDTQAYIMLFSLTTGNSVYGNKWISLKEFCLSREGKGTIIILTPGCSRLVAVAVYPQRRELRRHGAQLRGRPRAHLQPAGVPRPAGPCRSLLRHRQHRARQGEPRRHHRPRRHPQGDEKYFHAENIYVHVKNIFSWPS